MDFFPPLSRCSTCGFTAQISLLFFLITFFWSSAKFVVATVEKKMNGWMTEWMKMDENKCYFLDPKHPRKRSLSMWIKRMKNPIILFNWIFFYTFSPERWGRWDVLNWKWPQYTVSIDINNSYFIIVGEIPLYRNIKHRLC